MMSLRASLMVARSCTRAAQAWSTPIVASGQRLLSTEMKDRLDGLVKSQKVFLFMKGTPEQPMCGFSKAATQVLQLNGAEDKYGSFNVLEDEDVRQAIKEYADWPTIPQLYIDGEFVGGCDLMIQMHQNGEMKELLQEA
eukprot:m.357167 g.357167  ORF g.357167 m.357167 type:complete len:139 (+) comp17736_c0_seq1:144-560(+)